MKRFVTLDKQLGRTPLATVEEWRALHPAYAGVPLAYAGRLDPLAEGKLLVLIGDECRRQNAYAGLDKEYQVEVLIGAASDTGDLMGMASIADSCPAVSREALGVILAAETGRHERAYPAYSSRTVDGVPLFERALSGTLPDALPTHAETIHRIRLGGLRAIDARSLMAEIEQRLGRVAHDPDPRKSLGADFRRPQILARWRELIGDSGASFPIVKLVVACAAGTYMRSLAGRIGTALGSAGLAYSIRRTRIGRYRALGSLAFWFPSY